MKQEREQRGWSQARVAEQIGTDPGTVSRWERGYSSPSPYFRERLCQLYGKTAQELGWLEESQADAIDAAALEQVISSADEGEQREQTEPDTVVLQNADPPQELALPGVPTSLRALACLSLTLGWLTGLLVLLFYRSNRFVVFYSVQAVCFFGIAHIIIIVSSVTALPALPDAGPIPVLRLLLTLGASLTVLIALMTWIIAMLQAARGRTYRFPLIGTYCERIAATLTTPAR